MDFMGRKFIICSTNERNDSRDIYNELSGIYKYARKEKNEIKSAFNLQFCRDDSEKVMFVEIVCKQDDGIILWYKVARYFLTYIYSSGEKYSEQYPKRHMICHGIQTNYATKEMCLKLIICLDILAELAWRSSKAI